MAGQTPLQTVEQLIDAFHQGKVTEAVSLYEPDGMLLVEPGQIARGPEHLRQAIEGIIALKPILTTESYEIMEAGDVALYCSNWQLRGTAPDGTTVQMDGKSTDVLRRRPDGTWLIAIDNPLGTTILG